MPLPPSLPPDAKREKIDEMIGYIEERLQSLEEEKEELRSYTDWDKQRRSIEYTIHDKELRDTRKKLEDVSSYIYKSLVPPTLVVG